MIDQKWDKRFIEVARQIATWSSCIRHQVGAIIVKNNRILTTGYNGAPCNVKTCRDRNVCLRDIQHIESGTHQELCYAAHAEQNALAQAAKLGINVDGSTLYCTRRPCAICAKIIINSGIKRIVYDEDYPDIFATQLLDEANVKIEQFH